jgi:hypothetical protein
VGWWWACDDAPQLCKLIISYYEPMVMKVRCQRVSRAFASSLSLLSRTRSLVSLDFRFRGLCRDARTQTAERQATGLSPIPTVRSRAFSVVCRGREDDLTRVGVVLWGQETGRALFRHFFLALARRRWYEAAPCRVCGCGNASPCLKQDRHPTAVRGRLAVGIDRRSKVGGPDCACRLFYAVFCTPPVGGCSSPDSCPGLFHG